MRQWAASRSDHGSVNSARSGSDTPPLDVINTTAHFSVLEYNDVCGQKTTSSGIPTTYANTGYEGSQSSTLHDNMHHGELANPERVQSYSAQGCPMPESFSSSNVDGRGAAVWSSTEAGNPYAPYTTGVMPATTSLTATQTRTQPTVTQQATAHSTSSQGARRRLGRPANRAANLEGMMMAMATTRATEIWRWARSP